MKDAKEIGAKGLEAQRLKKEGEGVFCIELSQCRIRRHDKNNLALESRSADGWVRRGWYGRLVDMLEALMDPKRRKKEKLEFTPEELEEIQGALELVKNCHDEIDAFFVSRAPRPSKAADEQLIPRVWEFGEYVIYRKDGNSLALTRQTRFDDEPKVIGWHVLYRQALWQMLAEVTIGADIKTSGELIDRANEFMKWFDGIAADCARHEDARNNLPNPGSLAE